jgi:hypothetical protein
MVMVSLDISGSVHGDGTTSTRGQKNGGFTWNYITSQISGNVNQNKIDMHVLIIFDNLVIFFRF